MRATRGTTTTLHFLRRPPTHSHCIGTASGVGKRGTFVIPPLLRPLSTFVLLLALLSVVQTSQPALLYPDVTLSNHNGLEYLFSLFYAVQKLVLFFFLLFGRRFLGSPGCVFNLLLHTHLDLDRVRVNYTFRRPLRLLVRILFFTLAPLFESSIAFSRAGSSRRKHPFVCPCWCRYCMYLVPFNTHLPSSSASHILLLLRRPL
jgi:hypothetical protein